MAAPAPDVFWRYSRSPKTTGDDRPPYGTFHARLSPDGDQELGRLVSVEVPVRAGPRHSGQSAPRTATAAGSSRVRLSRTRARESLFMAVSRIWRIGASGRRPAAHGAPASRPPLEI